MVGKYKVITLCGSTRFKSEYLDAQKRLTLDGNIVISVGLFGHNGDSEVWTPGTKEMLDDMHKRKIDMADAIYVINPGGYIGSSTRSEILYAMMNGKEVRYLEDPNESETLYPYYSFILVGNLEKVKDIFRRHRAPLCKSDFAADAGFVFSFPENVIGGSPLVKELSDCLEIIALSTMQCTSYDHYLEMCRTSVVSIDKIDD